MSPSKTIAIIGMAILTIQSTFAASIGADHTCYCSRELDPICGTDDNSYENDCIFNCAKTQNDDLEIKYRGECNTADESACICAEAYLPVCGSDNSTYSSECILECVQKREKDLKLKYHGECGEEAHISDDDVSKQSDECGCSRELVPLCASNELQLITFPNVCAFECARKTDPKLEVRHFGECQDGENN